MNYGKCVMASVFKKIKKEELCQTIESDFHDGFQFLSFIFPPWTKNAKVL